MLQNLVTTINTGNNTSVVQMQLVVFQGGYSVTNKFEFITISTLGNAQDFGDLTLI